MAVTNATGDADGCGEPTGLISAGAIVVSIAGVAAAAEAGSAMLSSDTSRGLVTAAGATSSVRLGD